MQDELWTCQYKGCQSSPEQVAQLRERRVTGFPHDEDANLRVCTVCRRIPLREQTMQEDQLDVAFLAGIKEELSSIEENETNVQALSQVFRYYAKYSKQLAQVLFDFTTKTCFPWELIHALHLLDDILLMDNSGRYKAELLDRVQNMIVTAFKKVKKEQEKREVAKMLHAWQELKIFDESVMEAVRVSLRLCGGALACRLLDEAATGAYDDDDDYKSPAAASPSPEPDSEGTKQAPAPKRPKVAADAKTGPATANGAATKEAPVKPALPPAEMLRRNMELVQRIEGCLLENSFEILGIAEEGATGHQIRQSYRRIALAIHPDKNPGHEARCQEALIKLQAGREMAEMELQRKSNNIKVEQLAPRGETRSAATSAAANASVDASFRCKYPGCDLPPCKQCANGCCTRNITHCHSAARTKGGMQCFFHPPPRAWARNA